MPRLAQRSLIGMRQMNHADGGGGLFLVQLRAARGQAQTPATNGDGAAGRRSPPYPGSPSAAMSSARLSSQCRRTAPRVHRIGPGFTTSRFAVARVTSIVADRFRRRSAGTRLVFPLFHRTATRGSVTRTSKRA